MNYGRIKFDQESTLRYLIKVQDINGTGKGNFGARKNKVHVETVMGRFVDRVLSKRYLCTVIIF